MSHTLRTCDPWYVWPAARVYGSETYPASTQIIDGYSLSPKSAIPAALSAHGFHTTGKYKKLCLRYFTILDACSSGENRQTHTNLWGFSMRGWLPHIFLVLNYLKPSKFSNICAYLVVFPWDICKFPYSPMVKKQIFLVEISTLKCVGTIWYFDVVGYSWEWIACIDKWGKVP